MSTCADCGKTIELKRGKWANRVTEGWTGWDYCCRAVVVKSRAGNSVLLSADYHFVAGEAQRHYQAPVTIAIPPQPVTLVCPGCGLTRHLPENWQEITGSTTMVCVACDRSMLPPEITLPHEHTWVYEDDEYGSLAQGGSYEVYRCSTCGERSYRQLPD